MTTIEDKINLFSKVIYDKVNDEKEEKLKAFDAKALEKITLEKKKIDELRKAIKISLDKKYNIKANEIIAKEKLNKQKAILAIKEELINNTLSEVKARLLYFISSKEYKNYFISLLVSIFDELEEGKYNLIVLDRDYKRFEEDIKSAINKYSHIDIKVETSNEEFIGGVILKDEKETFKIDNSLYYKLEECKEFIGIKVMEKLA
ncbi:V-type ATP synthase subunit E [Clostridium sp. UBA1652]|uniref:V-type ATP synthase subunit E n=1 Tax=Clostridium sp. UBA1652 TaxID=1946348 RepID=UPI00257BA80C|nr:V-type ATP synthase subunit E family protein [Clostridium sp. UBA1652]